MNAHSKGVSAKADRATAAAQSDPQAVPSKAGIPNAMELWEALGKTDPKHTKGFKRAGGFTGTALKPMWVIKRLTEQFGPVGIGWGYGQPQFQVVPAGDETLVFCTVEAWHGDELQNFYGVGGDKVVGKNKYGLQSDDEAFKKAFTDALMNAFKHLGVGADIHMGQFDDSKYVAAVAREFAEGTEKGEQEIAHPKQARGDFPKGPAKGIHELKQMSRPLYRDLMACGDDDERTIVVANNKELLDQIEAAWTDGWEGIDGDGNRYPGFKELSETTYSKKEAA